MPVLEIMPPGVARPKASLVVEFTPSTPVCAVATRSLDDADALHPGHVDYDTAVGDGVAGRVVGPAPD